ncbi:DUF4199 domain-containing protein [Pontibacter harenae]|uniref:DUF4199 domain-containing protein n=1 Tax=Pontibacter harenae TaxID=2894083 RepID=UPI001E5BA8CD|nr:DUF4199 domain-containing protein [Pontibacter harenae]MCC9167619.1 DUF4199 domain-containing protein [Pontibacter harenae]
MEKIALKYGLMTAAALILYFLLMRLLSLAHVVELRYLNAVILAIGVVMALKGYRNRLEGGIPYFKGIGSGVLTAITATLLFAVFMLLYVKALDDSFVDVLSAEELFGGRVEGTPGIVVFSVLMLEGVVSGFFISFIAMQWFKRRNHKLPNQ